MKILITSDSHGNSALLFRALGQADPVDIIIHLGDGTADAEILCRALGREVIRIAGNCDPIASAPRELIWKCEGKNILLTHGDTYGVKGGLGRLAQRGVELNVDVILFGHSHCCTLESISNILLVNPGALERAQIAASFAILEVTAEKIVAHHHLLF